MVLREGLEEVDLLDVGVAAGEGRPHLDEGGEQVYAHELRENEKEERRGGVAACYL